MANHVSAYLSVVEISEEGQKVWDKFVTGKLDELREKEEGDYAEVHLMNFIWDNDDDYDRNEMCERIGAKWAYATDWDECGVATYSAWSPVGPWAEWIAKEIGKVDPNVELRLTYEDEFPNFIGVARYNSLGEYADNYIEWDELLQYIIGQHEELAEMYDEDACDWKEGREDEANEFLWEVQWEALQSWQDLH
ncbi:MAG: hypothetical protein EB168_10040 [Euryarchaeota archaeon]|nr:hypothetical protein [Euryarchaeota archaeon]